MNVAWCIKSPFFVAVSRLFLAPIQPHIQLLPKLKLLRLETDHFHPSCAKVIALSHTTTCEIRDSSSCEDFSVGLVGMYTCGLVGG
jgi:hypothetical protein